MHAHSITHAHTQLRTVSHTLQKENKYQSRSTRADQRPIDQLDGAEDEPKKIPPLTAYFYLNWLVQCTFCTTRVAKLECGGKLQSFLTKIDCVMPGITRY